MEKEILNSMFDNLLHIGNKSNYWNPKMKKYIYGSINGIHVIDLTKTAEKLEEVQKELKQLHESGKKILFVGTKLQARDSILRLTNGTGHYYVVEKWVPGLLTNFKTIKRRISTYVQLSKDAETGALDVLTKKEKAGKLLELEKLDRAYRGVKDMKKLPDVVFVIDGVYEAQAIREASILKLPSYAIFNTNGDDTLTTNIIPANTNSVKSIDFVVDSLKNSISGKVTIQNVVDRKDGQKFKKFENKQPKKEDVKKEEVVEIEEKVKDETEKDVKEVSKTEKEKVEVESVKIKAKKEPTKKSTTKKPAKKKAE